MRFFSVSFSSNSSSWSQERYSRMISHFVEYFQRYSNMKTSHGVIDLFEEKKFYVLSFEKQKSTLAPYLFGFVSVREVGGQKFVSKMPNTLSNLPHFLRCPYGYAHTSMLSYLSIASYRYFCMCLCLSLTCSFFPREEDRCTVYKTCLCAPH